MRTIYCILAMALLTNNYMKAQQYTHTINLNQNWTVQEQHNTWNCNLPTTAMGVLTANGFYKNVLEAMNYKQIDSNRFDVPWVFRKQITLPKLPKGAKAILNLEGIDYRADIKWNGHCIASSDTLLGPFRIFNIDVTPFVTKNNQLEISVKRAQNGEPNHGFVDWNVRPADENIGILRGVSLTIIHKVGISHTNVLSSVDTTGYKKAELTLNTTVENITSHAIQATLSARWEGGTLHLPVLLPPHSKRILNITPKDAPQLIIHNPRLWWCNTMGNPNLYHLKLTLNIDGKPAAHDHVTFGIRQIEGYIDHNGHRAFKLNGKHVLIRGAGWADDIFMRNTPENYRKQLTLAHDIGLNTIRFEGFWGTTYHAYSICDSLGLMLMPGVSCQWEWNEYLRSGQENTYSSLPDTPENKELLTLSLRDQVLKLRHHPSIICWFIGSDHVPYPTWEEAFHNTIHAIDNRPIQISAAHRVTEYSGTSGVKMSGPYEYVGPSYYFSPDAEGRADGFNTETGIGAQLPVMENLVRTVGQEYLWPIENNPYYNFHCTHSKVDMNTLNMLTNVITQRFGTSRSLNEYLQRANLLQLESTQSMFEAFRANEPKSTGVIHWMLNSAWPSLYWQLYDFYGVPTASYYGAKRANQDVQLIYNYQQRTVSAVNSTLRKTTGQATVEIVALNGKQLWESNMEVSALPGNP